MHGIDMTGMIGIVIDHKHRNMVEKQIEKYSGGDGFHTFGMVSNLMLIESLFWKGVTYNMIQKYIKSNQIVLMCEPLFLNESQRKDVVKRWESKLGKKYDKWNILDRLLKKRRFEDKDKYICSELIAYGYQPYWRPLGLDYWQVSPNDIRKSILYERPAQWNTFWLERS